MAPGHTRRGKKDGNATTVSFPANIHEKHHGVQWLPAYIESMSAYGCNVTVTRVKCRFDTDEQKKS